jgi:hypothetical protein
MILQVLQGVHSNEKNLMGLKTDCSISIRMHFWTYVDENYVCIPMQPLKNCSYFKNKQQKYEMTPKGWEQALYPFYPNILLLVKQ